MSASVTVGEFEDYIECSCGNDPISGLGFDGTDDTHEFVRCDECGAVYSSAKILAATPHGKVDAE